MHYVPDSAREFLQDESIGSSDAREERSFHYRSAPIYLLTTAVGLLLGGDLLLDLLSRFQDVTWLEYRTLFGFRLALLAAVLGGARILYQTLENLFEGKIGADLALTIATLAAIVLGEHVTAGLVVFIALCGESIEGFTVDRAQQAIRGIFNLCPAIAHVLRGNKLVEIAVSELTVGETVVVKPGERVPVDGRVLEGASSVDQSALTGESVPVDKAEGDDVFTGTLNQFGSLTVETRKFGAETTLAKVIQLVAEAAERKAPLERTADRLARLFLPVVLAVSGITLLAWRWQTGIWSEGYLPALSVLVVACPCPLILATPSAVMAAMAWLARTGVVVKGSVALERLAEVDTFAFDKTGTLTLGELSLGDVATFGPIDATELLRLAASAERYSEHLLARLVVREADARNVVIPLSEEFESRPGFGVVAQVKRHVLEPWISEFASNDSDSGQQHAVVVGNRRLLESVGVAFSQEMEARLAELDDSGQTVLLVALDDRLLGVIGVRDTVREESREMIGALRETGVENFAMLTGDRTSPAKHVAEDLGLADFEAELLPADKAHWIEEQTNAGRRVAMVGDGVNDAPALAAATVGIALGGVGSDIAAEAGDLVLMGDPLKPLPGLLRLSRQMVRIIQQSIWIFAFGMNGLGMLLGAFGILSPAAAAVFHEVASLAVMLNALRLLWFERWDTTWMGRVSASWERVGETIAETCSPAQLVYRLVDHGPLLFRLGLAACAFWWFLSGVVLLSEDEQAVVTRFGKHHATLEAGLHWRWPAPFEQTVREKVGRVRALQIGFRSEAVATTSADVYLPPIEWTSAHAEGEYEAVSPESVSLTGDEVPVEMTGEVYFKISDLPQFVYGASEPEAVLLATTESVLREALARVSLEGVLTDQREEIEERCLEEIAATIKAYRLGIEVTDLNLLDIHPPTQVVPAYRQVADALEEREQLINEAHAYYSRKLLSAAGEEAIELLNASVKDSTSTTTGVSNWKLKDELWEKLTGGLEGQGSVLSGEAASRLLTARQEQIRKVQTATGAAKRFDSLQKTYRERSELTGMHLYWSTVEETLAERPLTILDPKVSGKQNLFLADPLMLGGPGVLQQSISGDGGNGGPTVVPREDH